MPCLSFFVIPVETGGEASSRIIQCFQLVLDTRFRGYDKQTDFINRL